MHHQLPFHEWASSTSGNSHFIDSIFFYLTIKVVIIQITYTNRLCTDYSQSASDLSEQIVFDSWCTKQSDPTNYGSFVQQCIVKAFDWLQTKSIELSKIGNICNILAFANGTRSKEEFCVRLIYCLGFALESIHQNEIATKVCTHTYSSTDDGISFNLFHGTYE